MRFIHMADMHFDRPFVNLSDRDILGDLRRLEQRKVFKKIIEYIKQNKIEFLFMAGDIYEHTYVKKETIEFMNNLFKEIPETKIFISPGNHDPKIKNSYYNKFNWNENVHIFSHEIERIELPEVDIYGFGFNDFYCTDFNSEDLQIKNKNKINILIMHASLDTASLEEKQYNSIRKKALEEKGFDYIALGHIHKIDYNTEENQRIVYPGSTVSLGFDELGEHGVIYGELDKNEIKLEFISTDEEQFVEKEIDISEINGIEELIEKINSLEIKENEYVKIILIGNRNFEINIYELLKFIQNNRIIKIKDKTKLGYDLNKMQNETTLKGLFAKEMRNKLEKENLSDEEKQIIEKAIEIGIEALQ